MLARTARLTTAQEFSATVRGGSRAGSRTSVVHVIEGPDLTGADQHTRAGFVVGRTVGGSVIRNRVQRRLRHLVRDRLPLLPHGSRLVVRALPAAATATSEELARDLDRALARARRTSVTAGGPR